MAELVIAVSSSVLFDTRDSDRVFHEQGRDAYNNYMADHVRRPLKKGAAFEVIERLLSLNGNGGKEDPTKEQVVRVVVLSKNSPGAMQRVHNSIHHYKLPIWNEIALNSKPAAPLLFARDANHDYGYGVDLFLSDDPEDVTAALEKGVGAALMHPRPDKFKPGDNIVLAFDFDGVIVNDKSEKFFRDNGVDPYLDHEKRYAKRPLPEGPLGAFFRKLISIRKRFEHGKAPFGLSIVTARANISSGRVYETLKRLGGEHQCEMHPLASHTRNVAPKYAVLGVLDHGKPAAIFFDDSPSHVDGAAPVVPSGHVAYGVSNDGQKLECPKKRQRRRQKGCTPS